MAISIDHTTFVITIPKADLTLVSGTLYEHDTEAFRLELLDYEDSEAGMALPNTHTHNTTVTVAGLTYARFIQILYPFSVEYENGSYSVRLAGSNNNIFDIEAGILVQNNVQVIPQNSAGLQVVTQGSGVTAGDKTDIINGVWSKVLETLTAEEMMRIMLAALAGKRVGLGTATEQYMAQDDVTPRITLTPDEFGNGDPTLDGTP